MKRCEDCGAKVEGGHRRPGWWTAIGNNARSSTCRVVMEGNRMLSADYHYVKGEEQRHFVATEPELEAMNSDDAVDEPEESWGFWGEIVRR